MTAAIPGMPAETIPPPLSPAAMDALVLQLLALAPAVPEAHRESALSRVFYMLGRLMFELEGHPVAAAHLQHWVEHAAEAALLNT